MLSGLGRPRSFPESGLLPSGILRALECPLRPLRRFGVFLNALCASCLRKPHFRAARVIRASICSLYTLQAGTCFHVSQPYTKTVRDLTLYPRSKPLLRFRFQIRPAGTHGNGVSILRTNSCRVCTHCARMKSINRPGRPVVETLSSRPDAAGCRLRRSPDGKRSIELPES